MLSWSYWLMICILGCILLGLAPIRIKPKEQLLIELIKLLGYLHWVTDAFRFWGSLKQIFECCDLESHWRVVFVPPCKAAGDKDQKSPAEHSGTARAWGREILAIPRTLPGRWHRNHGYCAIKFWMDFTLELLTTKHTTTWSAFTFTPVVDLIWSRWIKQR